MKNDPHKSKEKYSHWKERNINCIAGINKYNSDILFQYLNDMEIGYNVGISTKKGPRSYSRLCSSKERLLFFIKKFEEQYPDFKITDLQEEKLLRFFFDMKSGNIKKVNGGVYISTADYVKDFKAFWHWWMKVSRKKGIVILDITLDLDRKKEKPKWVFLSEDQVRLMCDKAKYEYKVLIWFLYDTGIRAPTELVNIKVSDFSDNFKILNIRDETSKTRGRKMNLILSPDLIKSYIQVKQLKPEDYLFKISAPVANKYLKRLAIKLFGSGITPAGEDYSKLSLYDFRHNSACYWRPRYKEEAGMMYRFGWTTSYHVHYYSEFIGMKDTITSDDILVGDAKSDLEKRQSHLEAENSMLKERLNLIELRLKSIQELTIQAKSKISKLSSTKLNGGEKCLAMQILKN